MIDVVRRFNRFYTGRLGLLRKGFLDSPYTLAEVRILYELAHREGPTAAHLARDLDLDPGYLSRMLRRFEADGLVSRRRSGVDTREMHLSLTDQGRSVLEPLETRQRAEVLAMLEPLSQGEQSELAGAMTAIQKLLSQARGSVSIRLARAGDVGWMVYRHGVLYDQAEGWGEQFEALVAEVAAAYLKAHDPQREACWIAEVDGERVGSVMLVRASDDVVKLRLLLVEPRARGLGVGHRLVDTCIDFARQAGYRTLSLWTKANLLPARRIYQRAGFRLVHAEPHDHFGQGLVGETWELSL
ncbi:MAG TPA: bifunctional helix-turn-helix transcriptional regulator/GNAT family N-acetyltransferase [Candidatus Xenobia bacterium]|jgi:DNA-binding MarR family transcriptional regulator/N-acetylglutamate synthase-like GNAT family acetyltransferase